MADLLVQCSLIDLGDVPVNLVIERDAAISEQPVDTTTKHSNEYQAALELEMWKEAQEALFMQQVPSPSP